jgi:hypothetical protein
MAKAPAGMLIPKGAPLPASFGPNTTGSSPWEAMRAVSPFSPGVPTCICQHTSAYVSIRQHTSAYVSIRRHTSAHVSIRQHTSAYVNTRSITAFSREVTCHRTNMTLCVAKSSSGNTGSAPPPPPPSPVPPPPPSPV